MKPTKMIITHAACLSLVMAVFCGCENKDEPASAESAIEKHWVMNSLTGSDYASTIYRLRLRSVDLFFFSDGTFRVRQVWTNSDVDDVTGTWTLDGQTLHMIYLTENWEEDVAQVSFDGGNMSLSYGNFWVEHYVRAS